MSTHLSASKRPASEANPQSLTELFHLVQSLIPKGQKLVTASRDMTVAEAIRLMQKHNYSQLPVVAGDAVLGVFSFRSLAAHLLKMGQIKEHFGDLPVDEFVEHFHFVQPSDNWESTLAYLNSDDGVLVGHRDQLEGVLTSMDVLNYLRNIASPFVMLAEIELSLRRIVGECVSGDELRTCIQNCLAQKYNADEMPAAASELTLNDYVQIIGDGRNWPRFSAAFGKGAWQRRATVERLKEVRELRNDVFHFKRQLTLDDYEKLAGHREWLQMKTRAFEAEKAKQAASAKVEQESVRLTQDERSLFRALTTKMTTGAIRATGESSRQQWDASSFFQALAAKRGSEEADVARRILEWAQPKMTQIWWGKGSRSGSFVPVFNHKGRDHQLFAVYTYGTVEIYFYWYTYKPPFDSEEKRRELLGRLNAIRGVSLPDDAINRRPGIPLAGLTDESALKQFIDAFDWFVQEIRSA
jgi:CBS domain-containing protein